VFTYSNGHWEVHKRFQGDFWFGGIEGSYVGGSFHGENLSWGKRISIKEAQDFLALFKKK